ncbi:adenosine deaminase [Rothia nasimurium]|uniref:adenosine deaminase n=1 Tax=Rothia nasimurium TaxID=85336 RepID=A0A4Y9F3N6_9MICC|nr:adenosine deaminase [Rothia nasimurium]MBF0808662.1 adenosine deaminase [Rothia nasimurium]TFU21575.1 adenosine deaminase [Rothia nasimurium]
MTAAAPTLTWLQKLPKVCLHDHLDGGLLPETLIELADQVGHTLPATDPQELGEWFKQAADSRSLARYLETFEHTVAVMQTADNLRRVALEHVLTLAADGVIYGEVRWAPELHLRGGLTMAQAVEAVADGLMDGMEQVARAGGRILVNQILCAMRHQNNSLEVVKTALAYRALGVVGFDLAGPEDGYPTALCAEALNLAAEHFLPVTLHAGEAFGLASIREALVTGRALRLGHGVRITEDITARTLAEIDPDGSLMPGADPSQTVLQLGEVAEAVKNRRIVLETCPCSNLQTDAAEKASNVGQKKAFEPALSHEEHPAALLLQAGFAVTINPDNRLMSATSMNREFAELATHQGFGLPEFFEVTYNAINGAFCSFDEKQALLTSIQSAYGQLALEEPGQAGAGQKEQRGA